MKIGYLANVLVAISLSSASGFELRRFSATSTFPGGQLTYVTPFTKVVKQKDTTQLRMGIRSFIRGKKLTVNDSNDNKNLTGPTKNEAEIRALFSLWNNALATGDSRLVAARYASDAVLLPTVSDIPRTNYDLIKNYFDAFLLKKPQGVIKEGYIKMGKGWAQDNGIYEFTMGIDNTKVKARYSFVYTKENGKWKIAHHHSSMMPEGITVGRPIEEEEVKNLFHLWNDALATGDSRVVADRYAKTSVLLPTVSDVPRTDYDGIKDYFDAFLLKKPQGVILESNVVIGANWAQDAGLYEFTMGVDDSKVQARYTFVYVFEDGQWKISHHHSSVMPEAFLGPAAPANANTVVVSKK